MSHISNMLSKISICICRNQSFVFANIYRKNIVVEPRANTLVGRVQTTNNLAAASYTEREMARKVCN